MLDQCVEALALGSSLVAAKRFAKAASDEGAVGSSSFVSAMGGAANNNLRESWWRIVKREYKCEIEPYYIKLPLIVNEQEREACMLHGLGSVRACMFVCTSSCIARLCASCQRVV